MEHQYIGPPHLHANDPGLFPQKPTRAPPPTPFELITGSETESQKVIKSLMENANFNHFQPVIHEYLMTTDKNWEMLQHIRTDTSGFWDRHHESTKLIPPPDIFNLLCKLRNSASWGPQERTQVLMRVGTRREQRRPPTERSHLTVMRSRSHLQPSTSPSRVRTSNGFYLDTYRSDDPTQLANSPFNDGASISTDVTRKKASPGLRYHCPSLNCPMTYTRQGDYENHLRQKHAEIGPHDPRRSLRRVCQNNKTTTVHPDNLAPESMAIDFPQNAAYSMPMQESAPWSQIPTTNIPLRPDDVLPDVVEAGAGTGRLNPQEPYNTFRAMAHDNTNEIFDEHGLYDDLFPVPQNAGHMPQGHFHFNADFNMS